MVAPSPTLERGRIGGEPGTPNGAFRLSGPLGFTLLIVASNGADWDEAGLPGPAWEHVSVSLARRTPTWAEMEWVRDLFWERDATVLQFSAPREKHINLHPYCLHLWRRIGEDHPLPPSRTIA